MRGLIDDIRESEAVGGRGATTKVHTITGRDFSKIWVLTPIWFNRFTLENVAGGVAYQVLSADNIGGRSIEETVQRFLRDWLEPLGRYGRANWLVPAAVPKIGGSDFLDVVTAQINPNVNDPERISISSNFMAPQGGAWSLAKEWSDPMFTELFADVHVDATALGQAFIDEEGYGPDDTEMAYYLRGKPFVEAGLGLDSPWFSLPMSLLLPQDIVKKDVGRGGLERYNAFFVGPQTTQEAVGTTLMDVAAPLWDIDDIRIHGLRRFDVESKYQAPDGASTALTIVPGLRERLRDWYAINPYLYNGTINLGIGRPDIKAGWRLKIPGRTADTDETYYVESVTNSWTMGVGVRTNFAVTRGWRGSPTGLVQAVQALASRYIVPPFADPVEVADLDLEFALA